MCPKNALTLERLTMQELRGKFAELFGEATLAGNRTWLVRRILWRRRRGVHPSVRPPALLFAFSRKHSTARPIR